jgi:hypothetical protein
MDSMHTLIKVTLFIILINRRNFDFEIQFIRYNTLFVGIPRKSITAKLSIRKPMQIFISVNDM